MTLLVLWRHGQTEWNAIRRIQGQTDVPLSAVGIAQAEESAPRLAAMQPTVLVSSDLRRASATAAALSALTGLTPTYDTRLRERGFGEWEGLDHPAAGSRWPEAFARWRSGEEVEAAGVEEVDAVAKRMVAGLLEAVDAAGPDAVVVAATHGAAARMAAVALLGLPLTYASSFGALHNCHRTVLHRHPVRGWMLEGHNLP
ncbi:histidine phosphatase family protein [Dactylosporangium matsuzakiense]|uniref:Fructose 1,6-bisphosphatase n=1 Tax=Dactylosporangium matsuzakiense TaxID=53360 RepID=A0A9W6NSA0_9ACTN|nr:histidine phosphatase family protein [Dactylosporangium matsuzakiense]UWZ43959.1 histidine phosphatase family protein [Dactylosporangium matsuzakiense]GLL07273.1 fructose 1,6-bisphosphatase [Dactylosporangium matsuzakiense]